MEFYVVIKKDDALYVLTWKDTHDLVINRKKYFIKCCVL